MSRFQPIAASTVLVVLLALDLRAQTASTQPAANPINANPANVNPGAVPSPTSAPTVPVSPSNSPNRAPSINSSSQAPPGYVIIDPATGQPTAAQLPRFERPETLAYHEGAKAPRGYTLEESHYNGLIIGGIIPLSILYVISFGVASGQQFKGPEGWLAVPVIGPFGWLATQKDKTTCYGGYCNTEDNSAARTFVMMDGIFQAATAAMFVTGLSVTRKQWVLTEPDQLYVIPYASSTAQGISLLGKF